MATSTNTTGGGRGSAQFAAVDPRRLDVAPVGGGRGSAQFAATDPRRLDHEDSGKPTKETKDKAGNASASEGISPRPNILDNYASYTYNLSWYILTTNQLKDMQTNGIIDTNAWSLLVQSGGAAVGNRNSYFTLDYYLDDLEIESQFTQQVTAATSISFIVTEPNGITLLKNLASAAKDINQEPLATLNNTIYVMIVRFYGYDAAGNLVTDIGAAGTPGAEANNTNYAVIKYFPFMITDFTYTVNGKTIVYHIKGVYSGTYYAQSTAFASVPYNVELSGETVNDVLNGKAASKDTASDTNGRAKE